jgi:Spy/CpxP family protein refolding chaperone
MKRFCVALACAALASSAAVAQDEKQPPGGGRGGRGAGGRGGFGGGMMFGGMSASYVQLLEMKEVQEDLKMTADEKGNIPVLKEELADQDKKFGETLQGVERDQMREKFTERAQEIEKQLKEVLGDKYARFHQIKLQLDGIYAAVTRNKEVEDALNITEDQKTKLREAMRPPEGERGKGGAGGGFRFNAGDGPPSEEKMKEMREQMQKGMEEMQKRQADAIEKVLTPDQKKKWDDLIGAKVTYKRPTPQFGGFGRGQGGGAGGGRRGKRGGGDNPPPADGAEKKPPLTI